MDSIRALLVFGHLVAFAIALAAVLRGDWHILFAPRFDAGELAGISRVVVRCLVVLTLTGAALIGIDTGFDPDQIARSPKLVAKLSVVAVLLLNGVVLHRIAFPMLAAHGRRQRARTAFVCVAGAISTTSWLYATFIGIAESLATPLGYIGFMTLYGMLLIGGTLVALWLVRPRVERLLGHTPSASVGATAPKAQTLR